MLPFITMVAFLLVLVAPHAATAEQAQVEEEPESSSRITAIGGITAPADGAFLPRNTVTISGNKEAGSTVNVTANPSGACSSSPADLPNTTWSCLVTVPNGSVTVTATETPADPDEPASVSTVVVDVLGPPTLSSAPQQTAPGTATGTGHPGSIIRLLVNGATQDCHAPVTAGGNWLCTIANGPGTYDVRARQSKPGNALAISDPSQVTTITVTPAPPTEQPAPAPAPAPVNPVPAPPAPVQPPPPPAPPEPEPSEEAPEPQDRSDAETLPWLDRPIFPGPGGQGPTIGEALTNWGTPTGFGSSLPTLSHTIAHGNWVWAPLLALLFVGLIALPLRLLATAVRGRIGLRPLSLTGRNRRLPAQEEAAPRNPWLIGAVPLAAATGLMVLADGINGEVRYLRLLAAGGVGLAILNVVGVAVATRLAAGRQRVASRLRFRPVLLAAAAIVAVLSRFTDLDPPLVGGVLIGAGFALAMPAKPRALVNLAQLSAVLGIAIVGWLLHGWLGPVEGFWASMASETLATLCLAGLGSALVLTLPLGRLPGRTILEYSPPLWFGSVLVVATIAAGILLGGVYATLPILTSTLIVVGFAAVCVAVWAWLNYVEVARI